MYPEDSTVIILKSVLWAEKSKAKEAARLQPESKTYSQSQPAQLFSLLLCGYIIYKVTLFRFVVGQLGGPKSKSRRYNDSKHKLISKCVWKKAYAHFHTHSLNIKQNMQQRCCVTVQTGQTYSAFMGYNIVSGVRWICCLYLGYSLNIGYFC